MKSARGCSLKPDNRAATIVKNWHTKPVLPTQHIPFRDWINTKGEPLSPKQLSSCPIGRRNSVRLREGRHADGPTGLLGA